MEFMRIKRSDPEKVFTICRNIAATTAEVGEVAAYDYGVGGAHNGIDATTPQADSLGAFVGIWAQITARSAYGRVQVYGHATSIRFGGVSTVAPGYVCKAVDQVSYMRPILLGTSVANDADYCYGFVVAGSSLYGTNAVSSGLLPGFIRAM